MLNKTALLAIGICLSIFAGKAAEAGPTGKLPVPAANSFDTMGMPHVLFITCTDPDDPLCGDPKRSIVLLVGFAPGGPEDGAARIVASALQEKLGRPVLVENRAGASGTIAAMSVAKAAPNGYTLLWAPMSTLTVNPSILSSRPIPNPREQFEFVANCVTYPLILSVANNVPASNVMELVAWTKANPTKAKYASYSSTSRLVGELFNNSAGTKVAHVPFRTTGVALQDVAGANIAMAFTELPAVMAQIKEGKVRPLATTSPTRLPELPDVPTFAEAGLPNMTVEGFSGILAPKGTPKNTVQRLEREIVAAINSPGVRQQLAQLLRTAAPETGARLAARVEADIDRWTSLAKASNIRLD